MKHHRPLSSLAMALAAGMLLSLSVHAEECSGFKWPIERELALLTAGGDVEVKSGDEIADAPAKPIKLALAPTKSVTMPAEPGVKQQAIKPDSFSGWVTIKSGVKPGLYQVTLSVNGWIDAVQNGETIPSKGFGGSEKCKIARKSVRYEVGQGPLTIQLTNVPAESVRLTLTEAK